MPTSRCIHCGLTFKSQAAWLKHRTPYRTCLTVPEMQKFGMTQDARGRYGTKRREPNPRNPQ